MQRFSNFQPSEWNKPYSDEIHTPDQVAEVFSREGLPPYSLNIDDQVYIRTETTASRQSDYTGEKQIQWLYASDDGVSFYWVDALGNLHQE